MPVSNPLPSRIKLDGSGAAASNDLNLKPYFVWSGPTEFDFIEFESRRSLVPYGSADLGGHVDYTPI